MKPVITPVIKEKCTTYTVPEQVLTRTVNFPSNFLSNFPSAPPGSLATHLFADASLSLPRQREASANTQNIRVVSDTKGLLRVDSDPKRLFQTQQGCFRHRRAFKVVQSRPKSSKVVQIRLKSVPAGSR